VAHAALTDVYTPERPILFSGDAAAFSCHLRAASSGDVAADELSITMGMRTTMAPPDCFMVAIGVRGTCRYTSGRAEVPLGPGGVFRFSTSDHLVARYEALALNTVRLPLAVLDRVAVERFGAGRDDVGGLGGLSGVGGGVGAHLRFDGHTPLDEELRRGWLHVTTFARSQLAGPGAAASSPLVAAALADLVAATALVTFPNTTLSAPVGSGPGWVAPAVVRRAVAHMEAHAEQPLTVSDVARAAGVGPRGLQLAFARHVGCSPMAHLRRVRLERAHRELQTGDAAAGDTVAGVARRWGWSSASRFSSAYERVYGVLPARTLRT
jgi:AraC-like DNA-binding protein